MATFIEFYCSLFPCLTFLLTDELSPLLARARGLGAQSGNVPPEVGVWSRPRSARAATRGQARPLSLIKMPLEL